MNKILKLDKEIDKSWKRKKPKKLRNNTARYNEIDEIITNEQIVIQRLNDHKIEKAQCLYYCFQM